MNINAKVRSHLRHEHKCEQIWTQILCVATSSVRGAEQHNGTLAGKQMQGENTRVCLPVAGHEVPLCKEHQQEARELLLRGRLSTPAAAPPPLLGSSSSAQPPRPCYLTQPSLPCHKFSAPCTFLVTQHPHPCPAHDARHLSCATNTALLALSQAHSA